MARYIPKVIGTILHENEAIIIPNADDDTQQPIFRVVETSPDTRGVVGEETAFEYRGRIMQMPGSTIDDDLEDARMALITAMDGIRQKCEGRAGVAGTLELVRSALATVSAAAISRRMGADSMPGTWPGST